VAELRKLAGLATSVYRERVKLDESIQRSLDKRKEPPIAATDASAAHVNTSPFAAIDPALVVFFKDLWILIQHSSPCFILQLRLWSL
jgi:hypothetical protein